MSLNIINNSRTIILSDDRSHVHTLLMVYLTNIDIWTCRTSIFTHQQNDFKQYTSRIHCWSHLPPRFLHVKQLVKGTQQFSMVRKNKQLLTDKCTQAHASFWMFLSRFAQHLSLGPTMFAIDTIFFYKLVL